MFPKVVWQQKVGEVGKATTIAWQINSVHGVPNNIEIGRQL